MLKGIYNNVDFFSKALNGTWERNKAIVHNMANENTPNYKRTVVTFEDQLRQFMTEDRVSLKTTNEKHIGKGIDEYSPKVMVDKSTSYRFDGNNVNIETETADLAKNTIMYDALIRQVINEFDKIKNVISEGSK
ncbi:flagellar basal body rod protein FlgB [Tissierella sp. MSJ-40]|uniref:Flagellar basal body rod protein FlgB n=1 Tax=Tissierella simiarum TaxID=2841534 RepID=A0ABS6E477_9FIRM|nr:flagellar basal body rod protein FlgB [Tissierella simiarum]MBU5437715.1 flagellar basal body rod protein FlgB [Tissierella simiarum]